MTNIKQARYLSLTLLAASLALPAMAQLNNPNGLAFDSRRHLWIANTNDNNVLKVNATTGQILQRITTGADDPTRLAFDSLGNLCVANTNGNTITGLVETLTADNSGFSFAAPGSLAINGPDLYLGLGPGSGENAVISYNVGEFLTGDPKEQVVFTNSTNTGPTGITFDSAGNVYVSDLYSGTWAQYNNSSGALEFAVTSGYPEGIAWDKTINCPYLMNSSANNISVFTIGWFL